MGNRFHQLGTGQGRMYSTWGEEDYPTAEPAPERPASEIRLICCVRAARMLHLHQASILPGSRIDYAEAWSAQYKEKIPLIVREQDLTPAELLRLSEPGDKPEWNWLPGLQAAAEYAVAESLKQQVRVHLPAELTDLVVHYVQQPSTSRLKGRGS
jgi:hypothetical protein